MTTKEMQDRLREIVNKAARNLTDEDKDFLVFAGDQMNVQRGGKSGCVKCWHDFAMKIWNALQEQAEPEAEAEEKEERKYILRKGLDVYFGSIRVNEATLTDALAEKILARGFDRKFFVKC